MAAYGWTLEEALNVTLPQMRVLYGAIGRCPPINVIAPALLEALQAGPAAKTASGIGRLEAMGAPVEPLAEAEAAQFFAAFQGGGTA